MRIKKIFILLIFIVFISGCTSLNKMNYDDIVSSLSSASNNPNVYRKGFKFFLPKGLAIQDAGSNYLILSSSYTNYYLYFDLIDFKNNGKLDYKTDDKLFYSRLINYEDKEGYVEITLHENNKYIIEIMYNYAKIEVMVDENHLKSGLANTINILKSVQYDKNVIEKMLTEDNIANSEEVFDLFKSIKKNSNVLEYVDEGEYSNKNEVKDTDFID